MLTIHKHAYVTGMEIEKSTAFNFMTWTPVADFSIESWLTGNSSLKKFYAVGEVWTPNSKNLFPTQRQEA